MKKVIYKYVLKIQDKQKLELPQGAQLLTVQMQGNTLCLWALVYPTKPTELVTIEIFGTGNPIPNPSKERQYIGTAQMMGGSLVWHVFKS